MSITIIKGAKVLTMGQLHGGLEENTIENAIIVTQADRIAELINLKSGSDKYEEIVLQELVDKYQTTIAELKASGGLIDAQGKYVTPGLVEVHGHIGICEENLSWEGDDTNEMTSASTPYVRALDAINPFDPAFAEARKGGVTTVHTMPGSANVIGGETIAIKTAGIIVEDMVLKEVTGIKVAFGENPKRVYGDKKQLPSTRMGTAAVLRRDLAKAQDYKQKLEDSKKDPEKKPERDLGLEALVKVLNKEIPLRAHAHRADDIVTAIRIAEEFDVNITIEHCTEGHKIIDFLKNKDYPVALGPSMSGRSKVELVELGFAAVAQMAAAGLQVSILTDHPVVPVQHLPIAAALAVKEGMPEIEALKAITINPARHMGLEHRIGSIQVGKDADLVIWSGHPLDYRTKVELTMINGEKVYQLA